MRCPAEPMSTVWRMKDEGWAIRGPAVRGPLELRSRSCSWDAAGSRQADGMVQMLQALDVLDVSSGIMVAPDQDSRPKSLALAPAGSHQN